MSERWFTSNVWEWRNRAHVAHSIEISKPTDPTDHACCDSRVFFITEFFAFLFLSKTRRAFTLSCGDIIPVWLYHTNIHPSSCTFQVPENQQITLEYRFPQEGSFTTDACLDRGIVVYRFLAQVCSEMTGLLRPKVVGIVIHLFLQLLY